MTLTVSIVACKANVTWTLTAPWSANRFETGTFSQTIDLNRGARQ